MTFDNLLENSENLAVSAWDQFSAHHPWQDEISTASNVMVGPLTIVDQNLKVGFFNRGEQLFKNFIEPKSYTALYYQFEDVNWAKGKITESLGNNYATQVNSACSSKENCGGASASTSNKSAVIQIAVPNPVSPADTYHMNGGIEIHEYTHLVQMNQFTGTSLEHTDDHSLIPTWYIEGQAHVSGILGSSKSLSDFLKNKSIFDRKEANSTIRDFSPENIIRFYDALAPGKSDPGMNVYVYTLGFITLEALVAIKGLDATMQIFTEVSHGSSFNQAFQSIYGLPWSNAETILAKTVSRIFS